MNKSIKIKQVSWDTHQKDLLKIRYKVFVDEQGVPIELEHDDYDATALHLLAFNQAQQAVATARMLSDGHIGRMAVLIDYRGQGVGSELLKHLISIAQQSYIKQLVLNAQCTAEGFYQRLGFVAMGEIFDDAGIPHRKMIYQC